MAPTSVWRSSVMLMWLLTAESVHSLPKPTKTDPTTFETQYPPPVHGPVAGTPGTQGIYPTALERDGRPSLPPFPSFPMPNPFGVFENLDDWIEGLISHGPKETSEDQYPQTPVNQATPTPTSASDQNSSETKPQSVPPATNTESTNTESTDTESTNTESTAHGPASTMAVHDVFAPLPTPQVPQNIHSRGDHPVSKSKVGNTTAPIETNRFYAAFFLGNQTSAAFTHPYNVAWSAGAGNTRSWGMAVSQTEPDKVVFGPNNSEIPGNPASYYINPIGIQSMVLSAAELKESTVLTADNPKAFSANAVLRPHSGSKQSITFPVLQGMAFVTGVYSNMELLVQSSVFFNKVVTAGSPRSGIFKYQATMEDGTYWLIYVTPDNGKSPDLKLESNSTLHGPRGFSGTVQVAKNPSGDSGEKLFDNSAGVYAVEAAVSGSLTGSTGQYSLAWTKAGKGANSAPLMMFALPHHVESFDNSTKGRMTDIHLRTTTKGNATAVVGEKWKMIEDDLPIGMGFNPWTTSHGNVKEISTAAQQVITKVAPTELGQDMESQTDLNSMYFSGKALNKFAMLVYTVSRLGNDPGMAKPALDRLKKCFARFVDNKQQHPLVYDTVWKGVVSSAGYGGDLNADFGNTAYNDHHFHYGYFILTAAIIGDLDPSWIPANKDYVNMLLRDAGSPLVDDAHFPFSRAFDWYHGHSWAKGLFESFDGKDEESTSEDAMFAFALKMWGRTVSDASMEARGNLMLGVMQRTLDNYFLMKKNNKNQPPNFIANRVTGILFENKADHTTYFGNNLEYIEGIHMLPLLPSSSFTRTQPFVKQEWDEYFAPKGARPAEKVGGGWKGILYANLALIDPKKAWQFFSQGHFDYGWIDGGASRTWYLAFAAGLGGGP